MTKPKLNKIRTRSFQLLRVGETNIFLKILLLETFKNNNNRMRILNVSPLLHLVEKFVVVFFESSADRNLMVLHFSVPAGRELKFCVLLKIV